MARKKHPETGKWMYLVPTPDVGLTDPSHSWRTDDDEYIPATEADIEQYIPQERALA